MTNVMTEGIPGPDILYDHNFYNNGLLMLRFGPVKALHLLTSILTSEGENTSKSPPAVLLYPWSWRLSIKKTLPSCKLVGAGLRRFIIAFTIQDPLGDDLDDYDVDALLLSTESSLYTCVAAPAPWPASGEGARAWLGRPMTLACMPG